MFDFYKKNNEVLIIKRIFSITLTVALIFSLMFSDYSAFSSNAAGKIKLANKKISVSVGNKKIIKVKNAPKKSTVTYKSKNKKVATVSKKGEVLGIKKGNTKVIVSVNYKSGKKKIRKKLTCNISVLEDKKEDSGNDNKSENDKKETPANDTSEDNKSEITPKDNTSEEQKPKDNTSEEQKPKDNTSEEQKPKDNTSEEQKPKDNKEILFENSISDELSETEISRYSTYTWLPWDLDDYDGIVTYKDFAMATEKMHKYILDNTKAQEVNGSISDLIGSKMANLVDSMPVSDAFTMLYLNAWSFDEACRDIMDFDNPEAEDANKYRLKYSDHVWDDFGASKDSNEHCYIYWTGNTPNKGDLACCSTQYAAFSSSPYSGNSIFYEKYTETADDYKALLTRANATKYLSRAYENLMQKVVPVTGIVSKSEIDRAASYNIMPQEWIDKARSGSKETISVGQYYEVIKNIINNIDSSKTNEWMSYFKSDMNKDRKAIVTDGLIMSYLGVYVLTPHNMYNDLNAQTVVDRADGMKYLRNSDFMIKDNDEDLKIDFYWKYQKYQWAVCAVSYMYLMNDISPVSGKHIFEFPDGSNDIRFVMDKIDYEDAVSSISRFYEYVTAYRSGIEEKELPSDIKTKADNRRQNILSSETNVTYSGTAYYVSEDGSDDNDGRSQDTPWKTLSAVDNDNLKAGDAVFFRRGDTFRGMLYTRKGVIYSAYGTGEKPILNTSPENAAGTDKWTLYKEEDGKKVWKYYKKSEPLGAIFFDNYTKCATKSLARMVSNIKMSLTRIDEEYDVMKDLGNMQFYNDNDEKYAGWGLKNTDTTDMGGTLYLRCDAGNPGTLFSDIEFATCTQNVANESDITIDNLCLYGGQCSFNNHQMWGQTIQNCEVAYGGGVPSSIDRDGFFLQGGDGIIPGGNNNVVRNNYVHDYWDDGIAIEMLPGNDEYHDINLEGNLIEDCNGGILFANWFMDESNNLPKFKNVEVSDNYVLRCGYGWSHYGHSNGQMMPSVSECSCVTNGCNHKLSLFDNVSVSNNIFALSKGTMITCTYDTSESPKYSGNTYIYQGPIAAYYDKEGKYIYYYGIDELDKVKSVLKDETGTYIKVE